MRKILALLTIIGALAAWSATATGAMETKDCSKVRIAVTYSEHIARAKALMHFGYYACAIADLHEAIVLEPYGPDGHYYLAMAYEFDGQPTAALVHYRIFFTLDPSDRSRELIEDMKSRMNRR